MDFGLAEAAFGVVESLGGRPGPRFNGVTAALALLFETPIGGRSFDLAGAVVFSVGVALAFLGGLPRPRLTTSSAFFGGILLEGKALFQIFD